MEPLATKADYELLISPVSPDEEPRLDYLLIVGSTVVTTVAPGLYPWLAGEMDTVPVPEPAVLVTCQVTSRLMNDPEGGAGAVSMERIGLAITQYTTDWTLASGLLPGGWQIILKPWRPPSMASIKLHVPHPAEGLGGLLEYPVMWEIGA
jgi:hypothetical protein